MDRERRQDPTRGPPFLAAAKTRFEATSQKVRNLHEVRYAAGTWHHERRVIVKAEHLPQGPNVRFVVTNLPRLAPARVYDELYVARGDLENRIQEQQLALFADRTSCQAFLANQFRGLLPAAAYVLVATLPRTALPGTELEHAQAGTIRLKLFKVAARAITSVRRAVLHFSSAYPPAHLYQRVLARLRALDLNALAA
jgi:hypothetical protein